MIRGIWADEAHLFHLEQWVNVYEVDGMGNAVFSHVCQVEDLDLDDFQEYVLEPIDDEGQVISVQSARGRLAS